MATSSPAAGLRPRVDAAADALLGADPAGTVSVWLADVTCWPPRVLLERDADAAHYAASTMKLPLLVAAHRSHATGELDLDTRVPVHNAHRSAADGSTYALGQDDDQDDATWARIGGEATLRTLAEHATTFSGNLATNLLLAHVGAEAVAAVLADAGCSPTTRLPRGIEDAAARRAGLDNTVTAADLGRVLAGVAARGLADAATCAEVEAVLARQTYRDGVPAGLPAGTYVANKTGWVTGVDHDAALVRPSAAPPYVLVVLTTAAVEEQAADAAIAAVSRIVWEEWHR